MQEATHRCLLDLVSAFGADPRFTHLREVERELSINQEALDLAKEKDRKNEILQEKCRFFGEDSAEAKAAYSALFETKKALDSLPISQQYQAAFNEVHFLVIRIDDLLFGEYRRSLHMGGCHHD